MATAEIFFFPFWLSESKLFSLSFSEFPSRILGDTQEIHKRIWREHKDVFGPNLLSGKRFNGLRNLGINLLHKTIYAEKCAICSIRKILNAIFYKPLVKTTKEQGREKVIHGSELIWQHESFYSTEMEGSISSNKIKTVLHVTAN